MPLSLHECLKGSDPNFKYWANRFKSDIIDYAETEEITLCEAVYEYKGDYETIVDYAKSVEDGKNLSIVVQASMIIKNYEIPYKKTLSIIAVILNHGRGINTLRKILPLWETDPFQLY